jgi:profilin
MSEYNSESWDAYIDNLLGHTYGHADLAAIIGLSGAFLTGHEHPKALVLSQEEANTIGAAMTSRDDSVFQGSGIVVGGVKYQSLRGDDSIALGKKKGQGAITLQRSNTAVVIGHTKEGGLQGNTNRGVAIIAEYLESLGL